MKHLYVLACSLVCSYSFTQQSVNSSGGDIISSAQGSISFSVGQVSTSYIENGEVINEGVQQPYEIFHVVSISTPDEQLLWNVSPNPTEGIIYLASKDVIDTDIEIYDESGRLIMNEQLKNIQQAQIDLTSYARGVYTIKINGNSSIQAIRIIKN